MANYKPTQTLPVSYTDNFVINQNFIKVIWVIAQKLL